MHPPPEGDIARLRRQQSSIQSDKVTVRDLEAYESLALRADSYYRDDLDNPLTKGGVRAAIFDLLGLGSWRQRFEPGGLWTSVLLSIARSRNRRVHWVDAMAGHATAMRQAARDPTLARRLRLTAIDVIRWPARPSDAREWLIDRYGEGFFKRTAAGPRYVIGDAASAAFPEPADIVTCIEGIQYARDKLAALVNWYNQLSDGGLMLVYKGAIDSDGPLSHWMRWAGESDASRPSLFAAFVQTLRDNGVTVALSCEGFESEDSARSLLVVRKPGTKLIQRAELASAEPAALGYTLSKYDAKRSGLAPVAVVPS
jgi:hypothetical protein